MPQRSWGKPFYIRADRCFQVPTRNRDSSRDLGYLLAIHEPTAVAGVRHYQLKAQLHVGARFAIEVLVGRTVAQHQEFRVNSRDARDDFKERGIPLRR